MSGGNGEIRAWRAAPTRPEPSRVNKTGPRWPKTSIVKASPTARDGPALPGTTGMQRFPCWQPATAGGTQTGRRQGGKNAPHAAGTTLHDCGFWPGRPENADTSQGGMPSAARRRPATPTDRPCSLALSPSRQPVASQRPTPAGRRRRGPPRPARSARGEGTQSSARPGTPSRCRRISGSSSPTPRNARARRQPR